MRSIAVHLRGCAGPLALAVIVLGFPASAGRAGAQVASQTSVPQQARPATSQQPSAQQPDFRWPREVPVVSGTLVVYQPQVESMTGNALTGRAAVSYQGSGKTEPTFGVFWFSSTLETDREKGTATLRDMKVTRVRWPDSKPEDEARFKRVVEEALPPTSLPFSIERLRTSLAATQREAAGAAKLATAPPRIVFSEELAVLLSYDGEPRYAKIEGSTYERVINTPFGVAKDAQGRHWMSNGKEWYGAPAAKGPWTLSTNPPADLVRMVPKDTAKPPPAIGTGTPKVPKKIVVATEPTELIATDGAPKWKSLGDGALLYVENTVSPWIREVASGNNYLLIAGRWYRARSTTGPWAFVRPDSLPAAFASISPSSPVGGVRTSIAGTDEANDAIADAQIPQTAVVDRKSAKLTVTYDGEPQFKDIPGTKVAYALNTASQVIRVDGKYYAADNAVWFAAPTAKGPWVVADSVPEEEIAKIPADVPVYNLTHLHCYDSTPEVVYVGYTPGYVGSYPYYGVPVYGTGYPYPPYWGGPIYYPRPVTYGVHVGYNPWTGWNVGMSWSNGFFTFGISFGGGYGYPCCGGYHGGGYHGPVFINNGDINIGNDINNGNRVNGGDRVSQLPADRAGRDNVYNRPSSKDRVASRDVAQRSSQNTRAAQNRTNNVYAGSDGSVYRRTDQGWDKRQGDSWSRDEGLSRDANRPGATDRAGTGTGGAAGARPSTGDRAATSGGAAGGARPTTPSTSNVPVYRGTPSGSGGMSDLERTHQGRTRASGAEAARPASRPAPAMRGGGRRR
jgi:hypothetical protein